MKIPRDLSSKDLLKVLYKLGYSETRRKGSHIRLTRTGNNSTHHITIPDHNPIKIGTLNSILNDISENLKISKEDILNK